jgi:peptidyl-prolyl cis-trans isomerase B (cyclophilin B)
MPATAASAAAAVVPSGPTPGLSGAAAAPASPSVNAPPGTTIAPNGLIMHGRPTATYTPPGQAPTPPQVAPGAGAAPPPAAGSFPQQNAASNPGTPDVSHDPIAVIETNKGPITIRLFKTMAPQTVANFIDLCQKGFFNGLKFHRVEKGFCIQGGCPKGDGTGEYIDPATQQPRHLRLEVSSLLKHNAAGVVAMAHSASPDSASCQFYITLAAEPSLDGKYAIFGGVVNGMNVVNNIAIGDVMTTVSVQQP